MPQDINTTLSWCYEVRSPEPCVVTDSRGIHLCTAFPGVPAHFYGDGKTVTLSCDAAVVLQVAVPLQQVWKLAALPVDTTQQTLQSYTVYRAAELVALAPVIADDSADFICELSFTSGSEPTSLAAPDSWRWSGDAVYDGAFVPAPGVRYSLVVFSDGEFIRCIVRGVEL